MDDVTDLRRPVRVGGFLVPGNLFLAPVAGYSDAAYRSICLERGADLCYTEMVSAEALVRDNAKTRGLLVRAPNERDLAVQLFGSRPETLGAAALLLAGERPSIVDLNCGCPVPKIVKSGAGSALMRDPPLIGRITRAMRAAMDSGGMADVPVTVKIRLGWDSGELTYLRAAREAIDAGAAAVTLHARTRAQGYSGKADWNALAELVRAASGSGARIFGSGDASSGLLARRMIEETGVDGVMVARGAMGNPFVFDEARAALEGREAVPPGAALRAEVARRHLGLSAGFVGERTACVEFRKHFCAYTKGSRSGAALRAEAVRAVSLAEFDLLFDRWIQAARGSGET